MLPSLLFHFIFICFMDVQGIENEFQEYFLRNYVCGVWYIMRENLCQFFIRYWFFFLEKQTHTHKGEGNEFYSNPFLAYYFTLYIYIYIYVCVMDVQGIENEFQEYFLLNYVCGVWYIMREFVSVLYRILIWFGCFVMSLFIEELIRIHWLVGFLMPQNWHFLDNTWLICYSLLQYR